MSQNVVNSYRYAGCPTYTFNQDQDQASTMAQAPQSKAVGQAFHTGHVVVGSKIESATFTVGKQGTPSGTIYCRIWEADATIVETSGDTLDITSLSGDPPPFPEYTFTFSGDTVLYTGYWIGCEFNAGDATNRGQIGQSETTVALTNSGTLFGTSWWTDVNRETVMSLVYCP